MAVGGRLGVVVEVPTLDGRGPRVKRRVIPRSMGQESHIKWADLPVDTTVGGPIRSATLARQPSPWRLSEGVLTLRTRLGGG